MNKNGTKQDQNPSWNLQTDITSYGKGFPVYWVPIRFNGYRITMTYESKQPIIYSVFLGVYLPFIHRILSGSGGTHINSIAHQE